METESEGESEGESGRERDQGWKRERSGYGKIAIKRKVVGECC